MGTTVGRVWDKVKTVGKHYVEDTALGCLAGISGGLEGCAVGAALNTTRAQIEGNTSIDLGGKSSESKATTSKSGNADLAKQFDQRTQDALVREAKWEDALGISIEASLADAYTSMTTAKIAARGNEVLENQYTQASERLGENLRARGINTKSGVSTQLMAQQLSSLATEKAKMYAKAEEQHIAAMQQGLAVGQNIAGQVDARMAAQGNYDNQLAVQDQAQQRIDYQLKNPYEQNQVRAYADLANEAFNIYKSYTKSKEPVVGSNTDYGTRIQ